MSTRAPDTLDNGLAWLERAACRGEDPELFFAEPGVRTVRAKWFCDHCPVREQCLAMAMRAEQTGRGRYGIFGGLTHTERAHLAGRDSEPDPEPAPRKAPIPARTLAEILTQYTDATQVPGHLVWTGPETTSYQSRPHSSKRLAWMADRGRQPAGNVLTTCKIGSCVLPTHLADYDERTRCGTEGGYQRHLREGTRTCQPCRGAHAARDRRLHTAGSSKVLT